MISRRGANHSPRGHLLVCQRRRQLGGKRRTCNEKASLCDNGQMRFMTKSGTEALDYQRGRAQTRPDDPLAKAKVHAQQTRSTMISNKRIRTSRDLQASLSPQVAGTGSTCIGFRPASLLACGCLLSLFSLLRFAGFAIRLDKKLSMLPALSTTLNEQSSGRTEPSAPASTRHSAAMRAWSLVRP